MMEQSIDEHNSFNLESSDYFNFKEISNYKSCCNFFLYCSVAAQYQRIIIMGCIPHSYETKISGYAFIET